MGVPRFTSWLRNKYPATISKGGPSTAHGLYVDLNGIIHPCCHSDFDSTIALLPEEEKLSCICSELDLLVKIVKPTDVLYIAIDGVAPRAKMNQQRARRYMVHATHSKPSTRASDCDGKNSGSSTTEDVFQGTSSGGVEMPDDRFHEARQGLLEDPLYNGSLFVQESSSSGGLCDVMETNFPPHSGDHDDRNMSHRSEAVNDDGEAFDIVSEIPVDDVGVTKFDHNCISPGTEFMSKVSDAVLNMLQQKMAGDDLAWRKLCVVFSGSNAAGEGEHKIFDFIRIQSSQSRFHGGGAHVVVGLDADLIFLSLSLHIPRVFILRDTEQRPHKRKAAAEKHQREKEMTGKQKQSEQRLATSEVYCRLGDESSDSMVGIPVEESSGDVSTVIVDGGGDNLVTEPDGLARLSKFEYMNIELVGDSLLSEIKALCEIKGFTPVVESAFDPRELASSNGYKFCPSEFQSSSDRSSCTSGEANNKARGRKRHVSEMKEYKEYLDPCTSPANSKIIDDIIVLSMLLGNDFLPHSPSVLCGESALDNLLELYVSSVLPYGFLTSGSHEINLEQLRRLFESCATIEAVKFRRFQLLKGTSAPVGAEVGATVNGGRIMTVADAAKPLHSAIDDGWRDTYLGSTGLKENVLKACEKYVEGIRFVWRYYTDTVVSCDWAWYYPFYHAPLSHDVAAYLNGKNIAQITSPSVVTSPPHIYVQLLSVLPPTSHALLPTVLGEAMLRNPQDEELQQTFPTKWCVDYHDSNQLHLATVMLPFADINALQRLVDSTHVHLSPEEKERSQKVPFHLVIGTKSTRFAPKGDVRDLEKSPIPLLRRVACDEKVILKELHESSMEPYRPRTYSCKASIPRLTCDSRGGERKRGRHRKCSPKGVDNEALKQNDNEKSDTLTVDKGPSLAAFSLLLACASVFTVVLIVPAPLQLLLHVSSIHFCVLLLCFFLGVAVHDPVKGSNMKRNNIRNTFVDWLCVECLSLNFTMRSKCFVCRAPYDAKRCLAVFSSRQQNDQSVYDPDHSAYMQEVELNFSSSPTQLKRVKYNKRH